MGNESPSNSPKNKNSKHKENEKEKENKTEPNAPSFVYNTEIKGVKEIQPIPLNLKMVGGSFHSDIRKVYKFQDILGGGHFGSVRTAYRRNEEPRVYYAIKSISKKNVTQNELNDIIKEVEILSSLNHINIVKFYETYQDKYYLHIVQELCTGQDIFEKIIKDGKISEQDVSKIIVKILKAIAYCHFNKIAHRDIKPENILFKSNEPDSEVKLIDFGLSRKYSKAESMHTIVGTPYYIAPEVLKGEYNYKCDIWSIGAITYIMLSGSPAFNGSTNNEIFNKIINEPLSFPSEKWDKISKNAKDFISKCMEKDPNKRIEASEGVEHPWFNTINKEAQQFLNNEVLINLKNFSCPTHFKKLVLHYMTNKVSEKEIKELQNAFYAIDKEHTGTIEVSELKDAFNQMGIKVSSNELKQIFKEASEQNNSRIEYSEFIMATMNSKKLIKKEQLIKAFNYFDVDNNGSIDKNDIINALLRNGKKIINEDEIEKIIKEVDKNGKITISNFLKLFGFEE